MALRGCRVWVIDIDPRVAIQQKYARYLKRSDLINQGLFAAVQDGSRTAFKAGSFDIITNISAVEHFTGDGDIRFVREAARLLKKMAGSSSLSHRTCLSRVAVGMAFLPHL